MPLFVSDPNPRSRPLETAPKKLSSMFASATPPVCSRKERNDPSEHGSCNSGRGLSATAGAGNGANATPSAAVSATPTISPLPMQALGENNRGAANSDIPLAKHWLPADTFSSPLDGSPQLRHQLEKLARVFTKYERALILYEARSGIPGARRKSKGNKINLAIELSKTSATATFMSLRAVADKDAGVCNAE